MHSFLAMTGQFWKVVHASMMSIQGADVKEFFGANLMSIYFASVATGEEERQSRVYTLRSVINVQPLIRVEANFSTAN